MQWDQKNHSIRFWTSFFYYSWELKLKLIKIPCETIKHEQLNILEGKSRKNHLALALCLNYKPLGYKPNMMSLHEGIGVKVAKSICFLKRPQEVGGNFRIAEVEGKFSARFGDMTNLLFLGTFHCYLLLGLKEI